MASKKNRVTVRMSLFGAALLLAVGCGGPQSATASPSPDLAVVYLKIVAPVNSATDQFNTVLGAKPFDLQRVRMAAQAVIDAEVRFNSGLLVMEKSASSDVKPHIEAARAEISKEIADLQAITICSDQSCVDAEVIRLDNDYDNGTSAFVLLRSDLGLPPPPAASPSPTT